MLMRTKILSVKLPMTMNKPMSLTLVLGSVAKRVQDGIWPILMAQMLRYDIHHTIIDR